jgi:putative transcriptional regulator
MQALGGAFLSLAQPYPLSPGALASTLQRIEDAPGGDAAVAKAFESVPASPALLKDVPPLASLRGCKLSRWYWIGFGRRLSRVQLPQQRKSSLFLFKIAPERGLPLHSHTGLEFTQVLRGSFHNGQTVLKPGDFDVATQEERHEPIAQSGSVCVCLVWIEGQLRFDRRAFRPVGLWVQY